MKRKYIEELSQESQLLLSKGVTRRALSTNLLTQGREDIAKYIAVDKQCLRSGGEPSSYFIRTDKSSLDKYDMLLIYELMYKAHALSGFSVGIMPVHQIIRDIRSSDRGVNDNFTIYGIGSSIVSKDNFTELDYIYVPDASIDIGPFKDSREVSIFAEWVNYMHSRYGTNFVFLGSSICPTSLKDAAGLFTGFVGRYCVTVTFNQ